MLLTKTGCEKRLAWSWAKYHDWEKLWDGEPLLSISKAGNVQLTVEKMTHKLYRTGDIEGKIKKMSLTDDKTKTDHKLYIQQHIYQGN